MRLLFILFIALGLASCKKSCDSETRGATLLDLPIAASREGTLVETEEQYLALYQGRNANDTPFIDFSVHCLIGMKTSGSGCDIGFENELKINHKEKQYVYSVETKTCGRCKMMGISDNWILAEKKPSDYSIVFVNKND